METGLWKRLDAVGNSLVPSNFLIVVCRQSNESQEDVDRKIARWRAGEDAPGITAKPYAGDEELVISITKFTTNCDGSMVTQNDSKKIA